MAGHRSIYRQFLAFFEETTPCAPPADWAASGTAIDFISADINPKQELLVDPTAERRIKLTGARTRIKGIRNTDWSAVLKFHGTGAATVTDAQVSETYLSKILEWCCGGLIRTYTRVIASGTTTTLTVDVGDETGFVAGCLIAVEDTTSATAENVGKLHWAQIASIAAQTLTLTEALPFTPASGDVIHGSITIYMDETVLEDAIKNGSVYTWNWLYQRRLTGGTEELWQMEGTVAGFKLQNFGRGQLPQVALSCMSANFKKTGDDGLTWASLASTVKTPQLSMGRDVKCSISPTAATVRVDYDVNNFEFEPGFSRVRVETCTETTDRFEGMSTYSVAPAETKATFTLVPHGETFYTGLNDDTPYRVMFYNPGPGGAAAAGAGKSWAICIPKAQVGETPTYSAVNEVGGEQVVLSAMDPSALYTGETAEVGGSMFLIGLA
jgi:hypothetical protein